MTETTPTTRTTRTWHVRLNLDDLNAAFIILDGEKNHAHFLRGLIDGLNMKKPQPGAGEAWGQGFTIGAECRAKAEVVRAKARHAVAVREANRRPNASDDASDDGSGDASSQIASEPVAIHPSTQEAESQTWRLPCTGGQEVIVGPEQLAKLQVAYPGRPVVAVLTKLETLLTTDPEERRPPAAVWKRIHAWCRTERDQQAAPTARTGRAPVLGEENYIAQLEGLGGVQ